MQTLPTGHYLMCQAAPKTPPAVALREAIAAYVARFGEPPGVALVAAGEAVEAGVPVRVSAWVRPGLLWLGRAE